MDRAQAAPGTAWHCCQLVLINFSANSINAQLFRLDPGRAIFKWADLTSVVSADGEAVSLQARAQLPTGVAPRGWPPQSTEWKADVNGGLCGQQALRDGKTAGVGCWSRCGEGWVRRESERSQDPAS